MIWYALRKSGITEYLVQDMSIYSYCKTAFFLDGELSNFIFVQVRVHQSSVLSPLLFAIVMDAPTESEV